jgi:hypothetical protein
MLIVLCALLLAQAPDPIRVHLFTAATVNGFVDEDAKQRADSLHDVRDRVRKIKGIVLVDAPEQAELTLQVLSRGQVATGTYVNWGFGITTTATRRVVYVHLRAGAYETMLANRSKGDWKWAAGDVAKQFKKWLDDNRSKLRPPR